MTSTHRRTPGSRSIFARTTRATVGAAMLACALPVCGFGAASGAALPAPEPSPVPRSWQLDVRPSDLNVVILDHADGTTGAYYYLTYTVTNTTGKDQFFAPMFELVTDQGEVMLSGRNVPPEATREMLRRLRREFLEDQISMIGQVLQGPENAREGLVMWPVGNTQVKDINVYLFGFSGETRTIQLRNFDAGTVEDVVLRKSLMLRHSVPGDLLPGAGTEGGKALPRTETRWILRKPETIIATPGSADGDAQGGGLGILGVLR
ncbi:MAG: hypothetical protein IT439_06470 [Phycisphaerales bacterium]|nr:hypothetical protein [Phycisphaerales bacterium]